MISDPVYSHTCGFAHVVMSHNQSRRKESRTETKKADMTTTDKDMRETVVEKQKVPDLTYFFTFLRITLNHL